MKVDSYKYSNLLVAVFFLTVVLLFKFQILETPHHWDSLARDIPTAVWVQEHNFTPFIGNQGNNVGHPPFTFEVVAVAFALFGRHLWVAHMVTLLFSFLGVYFTFLLGSHLVNETVGLFASLLLFFSPIYSAQSGIVQIAIPFTALNVMTIYFALRDKTWAYVLSGTCLVLTKEPAIITILLILVFLVVKEYKKGSRMTYQKFFIWAIPVFVFLIWIVSNKLLFGWFMYSDSVGRFGFDFQKIKFNLSSLFKNVLIHDYRFVLTALIVLFILKSIFLKGKIFLKRNEFIFISIIILSYLLFFSLIRTYILPRYILLVYPFYYVLGATSLVLLFRRKIISIAILLIIMLLFASSYTGNRTSGCGCDLETNMEYLDLIMTHKAATQYIELNYPDATVLTEFPPAQELSYPFVGYVDRPMKNIRLHKWRKENVDLLYYSPQSNYRDYGEEISILKRDINLTLLARFEKNGKYAEVYAVG